MRFREFVKKQGMDMKEFLSLSEETQKKWQKIYAEKYNNKKAKIKPLIKV